MNDDTAGPITAYHVHVVVMFNVEESSMLWQDGGGILNSGQSMFYLDWPSLNGNLKVFVCFFFFLTRAHSIKQ